MGDISPKASKRLKHRSQGKVLEDVFINLSEMDNHLTGNDNRNQQKGE